jgi:hypothetical protein
LFITKSVSNQPKVSYVVFLPPFLRYVSHAYRSACCFLQWLV